MASFNQVILMGNLTRDPQLKFLPSQTAVAEFGIEIAPSAWGRGLATEASRALLAFAFRELRVSTLTGVSVTAHQSAA